MEQHFIFTDKEFEQQFSMGTFPVALFTHEAHLRLAWIHVTQYGVEKAIQNITLQLRQFVKLAGAESKYNHTLTIAAVKMVAHFAARSSAQNFNDFISEFPRLKSNFKELIHAHYSADIFHSETAKIKYLEPDLLPFE